MATIRIRATVEIDVERWADEYGYDPNDAAEVLIDAHSYLKTLLADCSAGQLFRYVDVRPAR